MSSCCGVNTVGGAPSSPPTGPAGGDLGGFYPNPIVVGIQGTPVNAAAPADNDVLQFDLGAGEWVPTAPGALGVTLQDAYDASLGAPTPEIAYDVTRGALRLDGAALATGTAGNNDGPDYLEITRGGVNILNTSFNSIDNRATIYSSALNGMDVGPDPALIPNRATITITPDQLTFLRQDRLITTGSPGFFRWLSTLNLSAAIPVLARSFGGFIDLGGVFEFDASASPFGMGNALLHRAIWKNANAVVANLGPSFLFANNAIYQADGATITSSQARIFFDNSSYSVINAGVGSQGAGTGHVTVYANLSVNAGWTIALRRGFLFPDALGVGLVTDQVAIDLLDLNRGTTNTGIRSIMTAGVGKFFIEHTGSALALFGGEVEIDGTLNHDGALAGFRGLAPAPLSAAYVITNVTTDRAYDANATSVNELADVLGTLIADLALQGLVG